MPWTDIIPSLDSCITLGLATHQQSTGVTIALLCQNWTNEKISGFRQQGICRVKNAETLPVTCNVVENECMNLHFVSKMLYFLAFDKFVIKLLNIIKVKKKSWV